MIEGLVIWQPPPLETYELNVDGNPERAGSGGFITYGNLGTTWLLDGNLGTTWLAEQGSSSFLKSRLMQLYNTVQSYDGSSSYPPLASCFSFCCSDYRERPLR
ncbi:hypothetical protein VNO77_21648 [Canavalia gladiata]|uniref:Uncharacterized protein n=1 Tax=Canavalia gladiata TaxID=3824 RepID=A0AAN9LRI4_CANGL